MRKPPAKSKDINDTAGVNAYMRQSTHPLKAEMDAVRSIIMRANDKITERVKWNAPSFFYKLDMAAFNPRATDCVQVVFVFHDGAMLDERFGLLEGDSPDRRVAKFYDMADIASKKAALERVVNSWVKFIDG
jgi:hypothetical protein